MAGLSMLLEEEALDKKPQVVTKVSNSLLHLSTVLSAPPGTRTISYLLQNCYLCRKRLLEGKDIYMYRERAFCTGECRSWQINMDERSGQMSQCSSAAEEAQLRRQRRRVKVARKTEL